MPYPAIEPIDTGIDIHAPFDTLHHAHGAIVSQLKDLVELPRLVVLMQRARELAARTLVLFNGEVLRHHQDEERELFPAVLRSAEQHERPQVETMVERLQAEHRWIERLWRELEPAFKCVARGRADPLDNAAVMELVRLYEQHACYEEEHFLPLAQEILGRNPNHVAAFGAFLHIRRLPHILGHI